MKNRYIGVKLFVAAALVVTGGLTSVPPPRADAQAAETLEQHQAHYLDPQASGTDATDKTSPHGKVVQAPAGAATTGQVSAAAVSTAAGGRWSRLANLPAGNNSYHMVTGPGGKILLVAGSGNSKGVFDAGTFRAFIWSPTAGIQKEIGVPTDMFCAGHVLLGNGEALIAGGTTAYGSAWKGDKSVYTFNFSTETFTKRESMAYGRWYPTVTKTAYGNAYIFGGIDHNGRNSGTIESYTTSTRDVARVAGTRVFPLYPHLFLASNGRYFYNGGSTGNGSVHSPGFWTPSTNAFTNIANLRLPKQRAASASCFIGDARNQHLMIMGGGWPATSYTDTVTLNAATVRFRGTPGMKAAKAYHNCVNLPDLTLLEVGGGTANKIANASREVGLYKAGWQAWQPMNALPAGEHRLYHSMAFLLDDGRVVSMGSNPSGEARSDTVLVFEPPYLFKGARPTIGTLPASITYNQTLTLPVSAGVTRVTMMTGNTPTHAMDTNQRSVSFPVTNGRVTLNINRYHMPPGPVRIFALNSAGAVSTAKWTVLR